MQATIKDGNLIIAIPLQTPTPSKSTGKTLIVASTHGAAKTDLEVPGRAGKKITLSVNAYIPAN